MDRWEYIERTYSIIAEKCTFTEWLNRFGDSGWELVTANYFNAEFPKCIFKRKIQ